MASVLKGFPSKTMSTCAMLNLNHLYNGVKKDGERWCFDGGVSQPFLMLTFLFDKVQLQIFLQGNF